MTSLSLTQPDDFHLHLRDGAEMRSVLMDTARQFARAIIMPNLKPPVVTTEQALAYRQRILSTLEQYGENDGFQPLMTLYLTDNTEPDEIKRAKESNEIYALKYYPAGATTNSENGVTDIKNVYDVFEVMIETALPLLIHGEVTDTEIDIFDREAVFIERTLEPLRRDYPELKIVFEHITTKHAVDYVLDSGSNLAATITPQHCLLNRNALFQGGLRPHHYCLPILKAEQHREAVLMAATSGDKRFFLGTDSAPHARSAKESNCGCAGIYSAHTALELYTEIFEQGDALDQLQAFASENGAEFYDLPRNTKTITLEKTAWTVPESLSFGDNQQIVPLLAGEPLLWKLKKNP